MSSWQDVLDLQLRLHRAVTQGRVPAITWPQGMDEDATAGMLETVPPLLMMATPVHVAEPVAELWDAARQDFVPEPFHETDPFVPYGFALLPNAVAMRASEGSFVTRAIAWGVFPGGASIITFAHDDDFAERFGVSGWEGGGWAVTYGDAVTAGRDVEPNRHVQAFWRLGREFVTGSERAPRGLRRAAGRAGVINAEHVTILRLRRHVSAAAETARAQDWSCQWIVRGHWRNQWHPSLGEHRQRYIAPYIKGPDDKPLRLGDRAVEFFR